MHVRFSHDVAHMRLVAGLETFVKLTCRSACTFMHSDQCLHCFLPSKFEMSRLQVVSVAEQTGSLMSNVMRKPVFCICENKDAGQQIRAFVFAT